jgi:taurine-pyruvate aminotransferase
MIRQIQCPISGDISTFGGCAAGPAAALENMRIIEDENLIENTQAMGVRMLDNLRALQDKHAVIGDVRGKGLFLGAELVSDRTSREPAEEKRVHAVVADCMGQGIIIGANQPLASRLQQHAVFQPGADCHRR